MVSLNSDLTEVIVALGGTDKLVSGGYRVSQPGQAWISERLPQLATLPSPSSPAGVNIEQLAALRPDLIVSTLFGEITAERGARQRRKARHSNRDRRIRAARDLPARPRPAGKVPSASRTGVGDCATFLGCSSTRSRAHRGRLGVERVRVYHGLTDVYHSLGKGIFEHDQIAAAGGVNVAAELQGFGARSRPSSSSAGIRTSSSCCRRAGPRTCCRTARSQGCRRSEARRVYRHPEQGWGFATPRSIFAIPWLANKLYPGRFADVDLEAKADAFYTTVYGFPYSGPSLD